MEIPSSSNIGCFDFALDDFLHSYHISSSSITSCFDLALNFLADIEKSIECLEIKYLERTVRLLKTFFLYVKECRRRRNREALLEYDLEDNGNIMSESLRGSIICFKIQDVAIRMIHDLGSALLKYKHSHESNHRILRNALTRSWKNIRLFLETDINKSCTTIFFDYYPPGDPLLVMDLIASLLEFLKCLFYDSPMINTIAQKLMLSRNLIGFVTMRGVECTQLTGLLTDVAVVAACLISVFQFDSDDSKVLDQMKSEIKQLIDENINPLDPRVRETYIHVLTASKKQSSSSYALALQENKYPVVFQFIASLHGYLTDLLGSSASFQVPVKDQLSKLHHAVRCLSILLKQEEKLCDEIKDLLGVMVCDAGVLIFSLSTNEIKDLPKEIEIWLFHFHNVLKRMMAEVAHNYPPTSPYSSFSYPRSNELGCIDFFLENLKELARCDEADDSIVFLLERIQMVQEDLEFLRPFLENIQEQRYQNGELQAFWSHFMEAAYKAELLIDSARVGDKYKDSLDAVARDINLLKIEAPKIHNGQTQRVNKTSIHIPSPLTATIDENDLVGLDDAVATITHRLTRGSKQLEVVPIVGMAGLGKTTLADKVYTAPSIRSSFHVRGWCCVSQTCSNQSLLAQLLSSIFSKSLDEYLERDENDMALELKQVLLRTRYLLVLDDLWGVEAWKLLETLLPTDAKGSRILFTSRYQNLSSQFKPNSKPYHLPQLTDEYSWTLLQKKLFGKKGCPPELSEVGSQIAKACRGLPLAVVLVAGILATTAQDSWKEVAKSLSSSVLHNEYCMKILELSYSNLPDYLKPCLLYFSAFQEDEAINVRRLLWLWISEGLVQQMVGKSLEEAAYDCLIALINRSLVTVTRQKIVSGAKACQLHDLVHQFCVEKAEEQGFLHIIHGSPFSFTTASNHQRVCVHNARGLEIWEFMLLFPNLRCLLLFETAHFKLETEDLGILLPRLLRVLDLGDLGNRMGDRIFYKSFPMEVVLLVHLRYLALSGITSIPSAIANLSRLTTLIVKEPPLGIVLPNTIWSIKTLSYLFTTNRTRGFIFPDGNVEVSPDLDHLDTLNLTIDPSSQSLEKILIKLPSIRRLKCSRNWYSCRCCSRILVFDCLSKLESLHLSNLIGYGYGFKFPLNLKKLTLYGNIQPWSEISTIGKLPNLEVLKLRCYTFVGKEWVMKKKELLDLEPMTPLAGMNG